MEAFWSYEYVVAGIVSSVLCLVLIILDYIFGSYAHKLTEWEYPRTQENFENIKKTMVVLRLRQISGIKYLNQMSTYHLASGDSEMT